MTWNGNTPFIENHKHSAKPRKRTTLSEEKLTDAAYRSGDDLLLFYEQLFKNKNLKKYGGDRIRLADRINAAHYWSRLVFVQPKEGAVEPPSDIQLTPEQHEEFDKFLLSKGISRENITFEKKLVVEVSEFLKNMINRNA